MINTLKHIFLSILLPLIISSSVSIYIAQYQVNQQYNQSMIDKRQALIEKSVKLSLHCHIVKQAWQQLFSKKDELRQIIIRSLKNPLNKHYNISDIDKIPDDKLVEAVMSNGNNKFYMSALDKVEFDQITDKHNNADLSKEMNDLFEEYLLLSTMSTLYFGPNTKTCFDKLTNMMVNDKDASMLNDGQAIAPCTVAMLKELKYNLKY